MVSLAVNLPAPMTPNSRPWTEQPRVQHPGLNIVAPWGHSTYWRRSARCQGERSCSPNSLLLRHLRSPSWEVLLEASCSADKRKTTPLNCGPDHCLGAMYVCLERSDSVLSSAGNRLRDYMDHISTKLPLLYMYNLSPNNIHCVVGFHEQWTLPSRPTTTRMHNQIRLRKLPHI